MKKALAISALVAGSFAAVSCSYGCDYQNVDVLRADGQRMTIHACVVEQPTTPPTTTQTRPSPTRPVPTTTTEPSLPGPTPTQGPSN